MCLYLIGSEYKNMAEVERLLNDKRLNLTEDDILRMKNNRRLIEYSLENVEYCDDLGIETNKEFLGYMHQEIMLGI